MTQPLTRLPRSSANGADAPPGTPRWVKAIGIALVVLLLAFAGLHLTGNAPTHMPGSSGAQHGLGKTP